VLAGMCEEVFLCANVHRADCNLCCCAVYSALRSTAGAQLCIPLNCNYKHAVAQPTPFAVR